MTSYDDETAKQDSVKRKLDSDITIRTASRTYRHDSVTLILAP